jgi:hypothetical protein
MVKFIPESLAAPFVVWMMDKGFASSHKKGDVFLKLDKEVLKISVGRENTKSYEMNVACQKRFLSFCRTYLNKDKYFIEAMRMRGALQVAHLNDDEQPILPKLRRNPLAAQFNY